MISTGHCGCQRSELGLIDKQGPLAKKMRVIAVMLFIRAVVMRLGADRKMSRSFTSSVGVVSCSTPPVRAVAWRSKHRALLGRTTLVGASGTQGPHRHGTTSSIDP